MSDSKKKPSWTEAELALPYRDITLNRPVTIGGVERKTLRMREPSVDDQEAALLMTGAPFTNEKTYFANLMEITPAEIGKLSLKDYKRVEEAFYSFL